MEIKKLIKNKKIIFLSLILFLCLGVLGITSSAFAAISHCDGNDAVYDDTGERVNCGGAGDCVDDGNIVIWCTNAPACSPGDCSGQVNLCACGSSLAMAGPVYCCASVNTIYANQSSCLTDCTATTTTTTTTVPSAPISEPTNKPIADILADLVDWLLSLVGIIAVAMIIIGGVLYLTAGGSERQLEMAKKTLIYTVIGLLICGISYVIVKTVAEILTK